VFYTIPLEEGCGSVDDNKVVHMYIWRRKIKKSMHSESNVNNN
jgi:hypothetical protein